MASVLLVSTGSEESFIEGMRGFVARHGAELARSQARVLCVECVGAVRVDSVCRNPDGLEVSFACCP